MAANTSRDKMKKLHPVEELDLKHEINQINVAFKALGDLVGETLLQNKVWYTFVAIKCIVSLSANHCPTMEIINSLLFFVGHES